MRNKKERQLLPCGWYVSTNQSSCSSHLCLTHLCSGDFEGNLIEGIQCIFWQNGIHHYSDMYDSSGSFLVRL